MCEWDGLILGKVENEGRSGERGLMTLDQVHKKRTSLGEAILAGLREECLQSPHGHDWLNTESNVPQKYCGHCYFVWPLDKAKT